MQNKKERISLPIYTLQEELWNSISHGVGAIFAICFFVISLILTLNKNQINPLQLTSIIIYGISIICLYTISCIYHALKRNKAKKVLRVLDHNMVFILIAGTYTPFCLVSLYNSYFYNMNLGLFLFCFVWGFCILGIVFNSIDIKKYNILCTILYIVLGWCIMLVVVPFYNEIMDHTYGLLSFISLVIGGVLYTVGAVIYGIGSKVKGMHCMFHFYVLGASIFQFLSILFGVLL